MANRFESMLIFPILDHAPGTHKSTQTNSVERAQTNFLYVQKTKTPHSCGVIILYPGYS